MDDDHHREAAERGGVEPLTLRFQPGSNRRGAHAPFTLHSHAAEDGGVEPLTLRSPGVRSRCPSTETSPSKKRVADFPFAHGPNRTGSTTLQGDVRESNPSVTDSQSAGFTLLPHVTVGTTGIEPAMPCTQNTGLTIWLRPDDRHVFVAVAGEGIEPPTHRSSVCRSTI